MNKQNVSNNQQLAFSISFLHLHATTVTCKLPYQTQKKPWAVFMYLNRSTMAVLYNLAAGNSYAELHFNGPVW